jgi:hypothetical protein
MIGFISGSILFTKPYEIYMTFTSKDLIDVHNLLDFLALSIVSILLLGIREMRK